MSVNDAVERCSFLIKMSVTSVYHALKGDKTEKIVKSKIHGRKKIKMSKLLFLTNIFCNFPYLKVTLSLNIFLVHEFVLTAYILWYQPEGTWLDGTESRMSYNSGPDSTYPL